METISYFKNWSEKLGCSIEEIERDFNKVLEEEKKLHPDVGIDEQQNRSLKRVVITLKQQLRSPAIGFEGIIIGVGDLVDTVKSAKEYAINLFKTNPQQAIEDGVTNDKGVPIDSKAEFSTGRINPNFNKPLPEHNYLRNIYGIGMKSGKDTEPKFFSMVLSGKVAEPEDIPIFSPVRFRAIDKSQSSGRYDLSSSSFTKFEIDNSLKLPPIKNLLDNYCGSMKIEIKNLEEYHEKEKDNYGRLCIVTGDVGMLNLDIPPSRNSRIMILEDETLDINSKGVLCWVPLRVGIDFAEQSKVMAIGKSGRGKKKADDGTLTEEPGDVTLNILGIYSIPEYKIIPEVKSEPIKEQSTNISPQSASTSSGEEW